MAFWFSLLVQLNSAAGYTARIWVLFRLSSWVANDDIGMGIEAFWSEVLYNSQTEETRWRLDMNIEALVRARQSFLISIRMHDFEEIKPACTLGLFAR